MKKDIVVELLTLIPKNMAMCEKDYLAAQGENVAKFYEGAIEAYKQVLDLIRAIQADNEALK